MNEILNKFKNEEREISNQQQGIINFKNFYSPTNSKTLMEFTNSQLNEARADYNNNYVIYPLPMNEDLKTLAEAYRLILISVEASPFIRYERA